MRRVSGLHGPECQPFYPYEHLGRRSDLGLIDYSSQTLENALFSDIDPIEIERLKQTIERKHGEQILLKLDEYELLQALQLAESQKNKLVPNITCIVLLGREESIKRFLPTHELTFQVLDNQGNVLLNDWFQFPLLKTLEIIEERFNSRNQEKEVQIGLFRFPTPDYSPVAFREALNNAVLHRDYSRKGPIYIQLYPDYLFISNPGGFLEGITLDNILVHEPKPRNPRMASVFRRIGLVETTGRGIDKIYLGQLWYGRPLPDYTQSDSNTVRLILKGGKANLNFASFVYEQDKQGKTLSLDELIILNHLHYERRVEIGIIAKIIQRSESYARSVIERLVERGLIKGKGEKRGRVYHLSAFLYRRLGDATGYVDTHGFDRVRQEAMILQYIEGHGRITRRIASDLCNLTKDQSSHLLRRMVKEKKLKLVGDRKGAFYELL
ncbi:MAG TPA: ATP-binding protein [Candidatus Eremiobacteraeota bacterium]|nr:ATP-binding protein [Candidatus Eremiobacteraeota bacterium]